MGKRALTSAEFQGHNTVKNFCIGLGEKEKVGGEKEIALYLHCVRLQTVAKSSTCLNNSENRGKNLVLIVTNAVFHAIGSAIISDF